MPLYEYKCLNCKTVFNIRVKYTEHVFNNPMCPHCYNYNTNRVIPKINITFKGEGFYKTDSKKREEI